MGTGAGGQNIAQLGGWKVHGASIRRHWFPFIQKLYLKDTLMEAWLFLMTCGNGNLGTNICIHICHHRYIWTLLCVLYPLTHLSHYIETTGRLECALDVIQGESRAIAAILASYDSRAWIMHLSNKMSSQTDGVMDNPLDAF